MDKCRDMVLFSCIVALLCCSLGWATDCDIDSQTEYEAQRDMLAYVQSTFPYRFGSDLHAGDYVQYEISNHHSQREEEKLCSMEVTERIGDIAIIKEEFEGNNLYYKIDLQSNTLLEYWGFDEDGTEQRPVLLSAPEVESRMLTMRSQNKSTSNPILPQGIAKPVFSNLTQREDFPTARSSLSCLVRAIDIPVVEGITPEIRQAVQEITKVYFSEAVPKLMPAKLMAVYLDNPEVFDGNVGLVKQSVYQLNTYNKSARQGEQ